MLLGINQAARVLSDPTSSALIFGRPVDTPASDGAVLTNVMTLADWRVCLDDEMCEVPEDVILKGFGPDALVLKERLGSSSSSPDAAPKHQHDLRLRRTAEPAAPPAPPPRFHLHFGAGRLGMGLVVPAISASGVPFALVQRAKPRWMELFAADGTSAVTSSVNSEVVVHNIEVIRSCEGAPSFQPPQSLVFGSEAEDLRPFIERATSFSCSLGSAMDAVLVPLLSELPAAPREEQPCLFCCENDHDAVARLKAKLSGRVAVIDCMVDRVCTGRTVSTEGVDVSAEPWRGSIVVLEPGLKDQRLPFSSSVATAPGSRREAEYLSERKFSLVNGMHTVLAFMTLEALFEEGDSGREYMLLKYCKVPRAQQLLCEAWRAARAAQLLEKYGSAALMKWHGVGSREEAWEVLLAHADHVLEERFSLTDDVVSRVLGGGVANRWLTRLRPTDAWMQARRQRQGATAAAGRGEGGAGSNESGDELAGFFAYALERDRLRALERGCSLEDAEWRGCDVEEVCSLDEGCDPEALVAEHLHGLTMASRRFCKREMAITHKELIKEQRKAGGKAQAPKVKEAATRQAGRGI